MSRNLTQWVMVFLAALGLVISTASAITVTADDIFAAATSPVNNPNGDDPALYDLGESSLSLSGATFTGFDAEVLTNLTYWTNANQAPAIGIINGVDKLPNERRNVNNDEELVIEFATPVDVFEMEVGRFGNSDGIFALSGFSADPGASAVNSKYDESSSAPGVVTYDSGTGTLSIDCTSAAGAGIFGKVIITFTNASNTSALTLYQPGTGNDGIALGYITFDSPFAPYDPAVEQEAGTSGVDVTLNWKAAPDPNEALTGNKVHPAIVDEYIFMNAGNASDPNLYYFDATGVDPGTSDPNSQYGPIENLKYEGTYYWAVVEALSGYEQTLTAGVSTLDNIDPNNIVGPTWSFVTLSASPDVKTPPANVLAEELDDPTFVCIVQCVTPLDAGDLAWDKDGTPIGSGISFVDNGIVDGQFNYTSTLQLSDVVASDEGVYTCTVDNGSGSDAASANLAIKRQVAYWPLDGNYDDESPEGLHDADPNGITSFVPGAYPSQTGTGAEIAGENGWAEASTWNPMEFSGQMTIAFWAYWNENTGAWEVLMSKKEASGNENLHWRISVRPTDGLVTFGNDTNNLTSNNALPTGTWTFIAATTNGTDGTLYLMPDSSAYLDKNTTTITLGNKTDAIFRIGTAGTSTAFNGILDDIQVFNYVMTIDEIAAIYNTASLKGFCDLDSVPSFDIAGPAGANPDCLVNLYDLSAFVLEWLDCVMIPMETCL